MKQHHIGWFLFALFAGIILYLLTRKKKAGASSVTHQIVLTWDSSTDHAPPSWNEAPPFQQADGTLTCALGYSLWQDKATGNYACYHDNQPATSKGTPSSSSSSTPTSIASGGDNSPTISDVASTPAGTGLDFGILQPVQPVDTSFSSGVSAAPYDPNIVEGT